MCRSSSEGYDGAGFVDLVPVQVGKWGKGDEKGVGHQVVDSYCANLMSRADDGLVKTP